MMSADRRVGMTAEIDAFDAQEVIATAAAAGGAGIMVEQIGQPCVVEGRARHADGSMHAQGHRVAFSVLPGITVGVRPCPS